MHLATALFWRVRLSASKSKLAAGFNPLSHRCILIHLPVGFRIDPEKPHGDNRGNVAEHGHGKLEKHDQRQHDRPRACAPSEKPARPSAKPTIAPDRDFMTFSRKEKIDAYAPGANLPVFQRP